MGGAPGRVSLITAGVLGATSCAKATPQARFAASTENEKSCNGLLRRIIIVSPPQLLLREGAQKVIRDYEGVNKFQVRSVTPPQLLRNLEFAGISRCGHRRFE